MKKTKEKRGITLIALVITIVILLILAGITIQALTGSGLFGKAKDSKTKTEIAQEIEQIKMSVMSEMTNKEYNNAITFDGLEGELKKYKDIEDVKKVSTIPSGATIVSKTNKKIELKDLFITTSYAAEDSEYAKVTYKSKRVYYVEIKGDNIGKIYEDPSNKDNTTTGNKPGESETPKYKAYNVGDQVTVGGENFYVIKVSGTSEEIVKVLAEKNIGIDPENTETYMKQIDGAGTVAFCTDPNETGEGYWTTSIEEITYPCDLNSIESERATAINYAKAYGTAKGGTGRLMNVEEIVALGGNINSYTSSDCPYWINLGNYWLDFAYGSGRVCGVCGEDNDLFGNDYSVDSDYGVRPVIEISKTKIQ